MARIEENGPTSLIEVIPDATPAVLTAVIYETLYNGQPQLATAWGELAGMNLVDHVMDDPGKRIIEVRELAFANQSLAARLRRHSGLSLY
jgi:hypothetical protein